MGRLIAAVTCLCVSVVAVAASGDVPVTGDTARGRALYENHCIACHTSEAHVRQRRKATDPTSLRRWIYIWQDFQSLGWTAADLEDVAAYLDRRFYKFDGTDSQ